MYNLVQPYTILDNHIYTLVCANILTIHINLLSKYQVETPKIGQIAKRGNRQLRGMNTEGRGHTMARLNLLIELTKFAFWSIKIRFVMAEIAWLQVSVMPTQII